MVGSCFSTIRESQEKGDYTVHLKPEITIGAFGFNVTHEDPAKREVFSNLEFRRDFSERIEMKIHMKYLE